MSYPDLQTLTLVGRIAALTVIKTEDERDCLVVTLYHRITTDTTITVKFLNSNGLLTAYSNNNLVIGIGSEQPVAVEELDGDDGVGGDAVVQGDH